MAKKLRTVPRPMPQVGGRSAAEIHAEITGQAGVQTIALDKVRIDGGTQIRVGLDEATVQDYADAMQAGDVFPPIDCVFDGLDYWLSDGFHRYHALRKTGATNTEVNVTKGTKRDAILAGIKANATHGLRRSNADKKKAVQTLLADDEWSQWSDRELARVAGVSDRMVNGYRAEFSSGAKISHVVKGADGKEYKRPAKPAKKKPANAKEKAMSQAVKSIAKGADKIEPQAVAQFTKGKDLEAAKAAIAWLTKYVEAIEND